MEASNVTPSFLCFLPELRGKHTDILYINGITESNGIQHFSTMPVSLAASRKECQNGTVDVQNRIRNADIDSLSNGYWEPRCLAGNSCYTGLPDMGSCTASLEASTAEHKQPHLVIRTSAHSSDTGESGGTEVAECNGHHGPFEGPLQEEDALAFEIAEFFRAFQDGQEHILMQYLLKSKSVSSESLSEPRGNHLRAIQKSAAADVHSSSDKLGSHGDEDCGTSVTSTRQSGKWSSYLEVDSLSVTFSDPLPFSGPMAYSSHSSRVPYSGSVSHRSDSSNASTHSFAFPILPFEWNSSPVKMAPPDKRYTQKRWKWRVCSLVCCCSSS